MDDLISRQAAIDALDGEITVTGKLNAEAIKGYVKLVKDRLERLSSAQPEQPEWVQVVERWHNKALCKPYIKNPIAWALYQTWKEYDK